MKWSDSILESRPIDQGYSLRGAYQPSSSQQLAEMLVHHTCPACGRIDDGFASRWKEGPVGHELGPLVYSTVAHTCSCGLSMPIFVVLNDLLREADHECMPAVQALSEVETLLPPPELEQGLSHTLCLLHRGDDAEAVISAEALARSYPDRPECHFNAGYARQRMGDASEALEHYERALAVHPQLANAWLNRGLLLRKFGRHEEARFCMARLRQSGGDNAPPGSVARELCKAEGTFDVLRVLEDEDMRALFIGKQCQGAMYLSSDDDQPQPGPFAYSPFTTGWLLAGCRHPKGHGLMLGLGSGAGAISLLSNFPEMTLRVVEIDGALIDMAQKYFPRLARLRRQGRLEIVQADARDVFESGGQHYDFVLLDVFTGVPEPPPLLSEPGFLARVVQSAELVLANTIITLGSEGQKAWLDLFEQAGRPVASMYPTGAPERWAKQPHNWILSTTTIEVPESFVPFGDSSHFLAQAVRNDFTSMCERGIVVPASPRCCHAPSECSPMDAGAVEGASASVG
ncbi:MAG: protein arginine N-methyltransferase [Myxococcota bacterium]